MSTCSGFRSRLFLPEDLAREILLRLPAKSVGKFRCVSATWLSLSTDPSFILAHARRAPKYFLVGAGYSRHYIKLHRRRFDHIEATSSCEIKAVSSCEISDQVMSSCDGLLCFWGPKRYKSCKCYVQNPLTGLRIDLPEIWSRYKVKHSVCELYCHRRTGEYRLLTLSHHRRPNYYPKAVVMNIGERPFINREIKVGVPYVTDFNQQSSVLVNDCLYWTCRQGSPDSIAILVFDTLEESFSLMQPPSNGQKVTPYFENYGLVEIDGELGYWTTGIYKSQSVLVEVWTRANGDDEWKIAHSLCLAGDVGCVAPFSDYQVCFFAGFVEGELLCLFQGMVFCLLHWDLKSGNFYIEKHHIYFHCCARIYRETLNLNLPSSPPTIPYNEAFEYFGGMEEENDCAMP